LIDYYHHHHHHHHLYVKLQQLSDPINCVCIRMFRVMVRSDLRPSMEQRLDTELKYWRSTHLCHAGDECYEQL